MPTLLPVRTIDSSQTPILGGDELVDGSLPANVILIEDRRPPWEDEPEVVASSEVEVEVVASFGAEAGRDFGLVADLAAGCIEPDTCGEIGACGEDGAAVCGPAVQPTLELPRAPWAFDQVGDPAGRGRVAS